MSITSLVLFCLKKNAVSLEDCLRILKEYIEEER